MPTPRFVLFLLLILILCGCNANEPKITTPVQSDSTKNIFGLYSYNDLGSQCEDVRHSIRLNKDSSFIYKIYCVADSLSSLSPEIKTGLLRKIEDSTFDFISGSKNLFRIHVDLYGSLDFVTTAKNGTKFLGTFFRDTSSDELLWRRHQHQIPHLPQFIDTIKSFKYDNPTDDGRPDIFYTLAKSKAKQLQLPSIEKGFDGLQIRVWYEYSRSNRRQLVTIINHKSQWEAAVYEMEIKDGPGQEILTSVETLLVPKSGWDTFNKTLIDLKIITLPDMNNIPGLEDRYKDGKAYSIEIATKHQYRFYTYHLPEEFQDKFWQAKNMTMFLKFLKVELGLPK